MFNLIRNISNKIFEYFVFLIYPYIKESELIECSKIYIKGIGWKKLSCFTKPIIMISYIDSEGEENDILNNQNTCYWNHNLHLENPTVKDLYPNIKDTDTVNLMLSSGWFGEDLKSDHCVPI